MLTPKKPAEIYSFIVHFIFAIIIGTSYQVALVVLINPEKPLFQDFVSIIPSLELLLAYTAIISGWIGYSRSMLKWAHTNTKFGVYRFVLDITILFCYFGLIASINSENIIFKEYFLKWITALFILFILWDLIKIIEHKQKSLRHALDRSFWKTMIFLVIFISIVPWIYNYLLANQLGIINEETIYGGVLLFVTILLLLYRYWKWSIPPQKRLVKSNEK